jgi:hypothetical protein
VNRAPAILLLTALLAWPQRSESRWQGLQFLIGNWKGAGAGDPGPGSGKFSFQPDLNGQVVVRRSFNELAKGSRHEDLLVVYAEGPDGAQRAIYFDSEGHVIRYKVATPAPGRAVFESEGEGPQYRLSYWVEEGNVWKGKFEAGDRTYLEWDAVRDGK